MDLDDEGMGVLADLHGDGDPDDERAREEFREIKESVFSEREMGDRSYKSMWKRYRGRVLLAVSAQAFAQLVSVSLSLFWRIGLDPLVELTGRGSAFYRMASTSSRITLLSCLNLPVGSVEMPSS